MSRFAMTKGLKEPAAATDVGEDEGMPDMDDPKVMAAMNELERDMEHMDENNPKHMAHMMRKMKDVMPPGTVPKEMEDAIRRLESGEDPEKIEAEMGDLFGGMGDEEDEMGMGGGFGGSTVNLVSIEQTELFKHIVTKDYERIQQVKPEIYVLEASNGAEEI